MESVTLKIEPTNNATVLKLTANKILVKENFHFQHIDETENAPLAKELFQLPFIKQIYISTNFIALERYDFVDWPTVQNDVKEQIESYLNQGGAIVQAAETKKYPIEVFAESTPNPEVLKFVTNIKLVPQDYEFKTAEEAQKAPLALQLFQMPFVKEIFISGTYIAVTKTEQVNWLEIQNELRNFIREYLTAGNDVVVDLAPANENTTNHDAEPTDETSKQIIGILDEYIRPAVAADGGNILFQSYNADTKVVNVMLQGACSGCPSSTITLKNGIEHMLKQLIPGKIEEVVAINQ